MGVWGQTLALAHAGFRIWDLRFSSVAQGVMASIYMSPQSLMHLQTALLEGSLKVWPARVYLPSQLLLRPSVSHLPPTTLRATFLCHAPQGILPQSQQTMH